MKYIVVHDTNGQEFMKQVNAFMDEGYQLAGGVSTLYDANYKVHFYQAMTKV